jgi:predicted nucleic acid-binding protein
MKTPKINRLPIFIDTSAIISAFCKDDDNHLTARNYAYMLAKNNYNVITSNLVLVETFNFIKRKNTAPESNKLCWAIKNSSFFTILYSNEEIENRAFEIFIKFSDQRFSYTDCTSFTFMKLHDINQAFTFDDDFKIFGFKVNPELRSSS